VGFGETAADRPIAMAADAMMTTRPTRDAMTIRLPRTERTILLRTDFSDDAAWVALCEAIQAPQTRFGDEFRAYVSPVSDRAFDGASVSLLVELAGAAEKSFLLVADRIALTSAERPVLVVDALHDVGSTFRVIPSEAWGVENNLWLANMDFEDFADAVDSDGVFRGFR